MLLNNTKFQQNPNCITKLEKEVIMTTLEMKRRDVNIKLAKEIVDRARVCEKVFADNSGALSNATYIYDTFISKHTWDDLEDYHGRMMDALQLHCNKFNWEYFKEVVANLANELRQSAYFNM